MRSRLRRAACWVTGKRSVLLATCPTPTAKSVFPSPCNIPQAPTLGFSGIPGTGEPIGGSGTAPSTTQSVLTLNTHVVDNNAAFQFGETYSHAIAFQFGGTSNIL